MKVLGFLFLGAVVYLKAVLWKEKWGGNPPWAGWIEAFGRRSRKKRLAALFLIALAVYLLLTLVLVSKNITFSGDEPYYLLTTHSLYKDGDINVANNYANRDYFNYYSREQHPSLHLGVYAREGRKGNQYLYPINLPGVSVLMLPFYALSRLFRGNLLTFILKGSLSIWAVLLGLQLYLFARERFSKEKTALTLWFVYSFSAPVFFYAVHLYPEVPIAVAGLFIYRKISSAAPITTIQAFAMGSCLSVFPWFGLKFNLIFWPLLIIVVYDFVARRRQIRTILAFLALPLASTGLFYVFVYALYGTFSPFAIYEGIMTPEKVQEVKYQITGIPVMLRVDSFFDYFLDQRDGLLLYAPVYLFALAGLVEAFRRSKKDFIAFLLLSLPYLINYGFFTHRQGHSPQGRILTPLSWIGAIAIGYFLVHNRKKVYSFLFGAAVVISLAFNLILIQYPGFLYQPTTHEFTFRGGGLFVYLSNLHFYLPKYLPSFIKVDNLGYIPNYIWAGLVLLFLGIYIKKRGKAKPLAFGFHLGFCAVALAVLFTGFVLYPRGTLLFPARANYLHGERLAFYSLENQVQMKQPGKFSLSQDSRHYEFIFSSQHPLRKLDLSFGSSAGDYPVEMQIFDRPLFAGRTERGMKSLTVDSPPHYRLKNLYLYEITFYLGSQTEVATIENPFFLGIQPHSAK